MSALDLAWDEIASPGIGYPNLARSNLAHPFTPAWREFDRHWPRVVPLRLLMYLQHAGIVCNNHKIATAPIGSWYPVGWSWFDFGIDYIALMPFNTIDRVLKKEIRILFYYHEGDNPNRICDRLDSLVASHNLPENCYLLISANSSARYHPRSIYFDDHECFFRYLNREQKFRPNQDLPIYDFTLLSRTHKWWRCAVVADLWRENSLTNSLWSYNTELSVGDSIDDNPISLDMIPDLRHDMTKFLAGAPYLCDDLGSILQNDHHSVNPDLYQRSFLHLILETHFDADQSGGAFLTEKTYKCIKFCQPFVIIGTQGSLAALRSHGYRVFDNVIDNAYDTITDATERWLALRGVIQRIQHDGPKKIWAACQLDVRHNYDMFYYRTIQAVSSVVEEIQCRQ